MYNVIAIFCSNWYKIQPSFKSDLCCQAFNMPGSRLASPALSARQSAERRPSPETQVQVQAQPQLAQLASEWLEVRRRPARRQQRAQCRSGLALVGSVPWSLARR